MTELSFYLLKAVYNSTQKIFVRSLECSMADQPKECSIVDQLALRLGRT